MRYVVAHLLFYHVVFLGVGDVVHGDFEVALRIYEHLHGEVCPSRGYREARYRRGAARRASRPAVQFHVLQRRAECRVVPQRAYVAGRVGQYGVHVLREARVGVDNLAPVVEYGYPAFEVLEVLEQPFASGPRLAAFFVKLLVSFHYLASYLAELRVGEVDFHVRQPPFFGLADESAQARYGFAHAVGQENEHYYHYGEHYEHEPQEHAARPQEVAYVGRIRQGHPHDEVRVRFGVVEILRFHRGRLAYVVAVGLGERFHYLGAVGVVSHPLGGVVFRFVEHAAVVPHDSHPYGAVGQCCYEMFYFLGGHLAGISLHYAGCQVGVALQPFAQQSCAVALLVAHFECHEHGREHGERSRERQEQFVFVA